MCSSKLQALTGVDFGALVSTFCSIVSNASLVYSAIVWINSSLFRFLWIFHGNEAWLDFLYSEIHCTRSLAHFSVDCYPCFSLRCWWLFSAAFLLVFTNNVLGEKWNLMNSNIPSSLFLVESVLIEYGITQLTDLSFLVSYFNENAITCERMLYDSVFCVKRDKYRCHITSNFMNFTRHTKSFLANQIFGWASCHQTVC